MSQFFSKITLLIVLIAITILGIIFIFSKEIQQNFFAGIADKHKWAASIKEPKIILVGGSNLAFGVASDSIEKALHHPVINLGLYAGFGLDFILKDALTEVKKGDWVVLCPEYYLDKAGDNYSKQAATMSYPEANKYINYANLKDKFEKKALFFIRYARNLIFFPNRISNPSIEDTISDYFRKGFSERGDLVSHLNNAPHKLDKFDKVEPQDYSPEIVLINQFIKTVEKKGAIVYWTFPSYSYSAYKGNLQGLSFFEKQIIEKVNCKKISQIKDDIYPDDCFYDTHFHLNGDCRIQRTNKLISALKKNIH